MTDLVFLSSPGFLFGRHGVENRSHLGVDLRRGCFSHVFKHCTGVVETHFRANLKETGFEKIMFLSSLVKCLFGPCLCRFRKGPNSSADGGPFRFGIICGSPGSTFSASFGHLGSRIVFALPRLSDLYACGGVPHRVPAASRSLHRLGLAAVFIITRVMRPGIPSGISLGLTCIMSQVYPKRYQSGLDSFLVRRRLKKQNKWG